MRLSKFSSGFSDDVLFDDWRRNYSVYTFQCAQMLNRADAIKMDIMYDNFEHLYTIGHHFSETSLTNVSPKGKVYNTHGCVYGSASSSHTS